jgi:ssDNA-binding Zn-finger/Zn-ribbon topoisomerase 1
MYIDPPPDGMISDDILLLLDTLAVNYSSFQEEGGAELPEEDEHLGACPLCGWKFGGGGRVVEREGPYGSFWGCSNYPKCRYTKSKGRR